MRYHLGTHVEEATCSEPPPLKYIITKLDKFKAKKPMTILDLGCGILPQIRTYFQGRPNYTVRSFDHLSMVPGVEACDITHLPVEDESAMIVVLSQAMLGSNCKDYLREAYRVLDEFGRMYIAELTEKWTPKGSRPSFQLLELLVECGFSVTDQFHGKFTVFDCVKR
jgi:ubiquinone/menaquinone biosynthesis C-methylase UbiE